MHMRDKLDEEITLSSNDKINNITNLHNKGKRLSIKIFNLDYEKQKEKELIEISPYEQLMKKKEKIEGLVPEFRINILNNDEDENKQEQVKEDKKSMISDESIEIKSIELDQIINKLNNQRGLIKCKSKNALKFNLNPMRKQFVLKDFNSKLLPEFKKVHLSKSEVNLNIFKTELMDKPIFKNINEITATSQIMNRKKKINSLSNILPKKSQNVPLKEVKYNAVLENISKISEKRDKMLNEMIKSQKSNII